MNVLPHTNKRTAMAAAIAVALGSTAPLQTANAVVYTFNWEGLFTMLDPTGKPLGNTSIGYYDADYIDWATYRTSITGTLTYDTDTGLGSMTINDFDFFNGTAPAQAQTITIDNIGDGAGGAGNLILGNMLFNWNGNNGIPVSVVFDATGLMNDIGDGIVVGDVVTGAGAIPASNGIKSSAYPIGAVPVATTTWNTTDLCTDMSGLSNGDCMGVNPSGSEPLIADTLGGDPMIDGPFTGYSANFDLTSMTLASDGSGPTFTAPDDPDVTVSAALGDDVPVNLGTVTDEAAPTGDPTCNVTVEYDAGSGWTTDDGTNTINVNLTGTVTTLTVNWRATTTASDPVTCAADTISTATQAVTVTIDDNTAPTFTAVPADFSITVDSTAETITFEGPTSGRGTITASDAVDDTPLIQWSLDGLNWTNNTPGDESSDAFGSGTNIVYWRVTDDSENETTYEQQVTVNLPTGIVGQPCTVDPDLLDAAIGNRQLEGTFTMRDPAGAIVGTVDPYVTGSINTATVCADESCTSSGAQLSSPTPFYGNLWTTNTIRLFNQPGTYSFNTIQDGNPSLSMTVGANQLGAHMLFDWSVNRDIDVVLVWNYGCGASELVTTDPDGDGIIGTRMVDGPFQGFNAAFDLHTVDGAQPITSGGYSVTVPVVNNTVDNTSPLTIDPGTIGSTFGGVVITTTQLSSSGASDDSRVITSCVGGCFDFSVSGRAAGETIQVVLPLSEPIPWYSLYRKYNAATDSWANFVVNGTDNVMTAPLNAEGRCPEPGAGDYTSYSSGILAGMLRPDDQCVQLTITDNGPNDSDSADGVIADPSGVGVTAAPSEPEASTSGGGGCTLTKDGTASQHLDLWLLAGLLGLLGMRRKAQS